MPLPPSSVLGVPDQVASDSVMAALGQMAAGDLGTARVTDRVAMDTFDGRLHARGWRLWRDARAGRDGTVALALEQPGHPPLAARCRPSRRGHLRPAELPPGPVGDRLRAAVGDRALLDRARVRSRLRSADVRNHRGKAVVRVAIEEPSLVEAGGQPVALGRRLHVNGVLGYDRHFSRVLDLLATRVGLAAAAEPLADEAMRAGGVEPGGASSGLDLALDAGMRADQATLLVCRRLAAMVEANLPGAVQDLDPEFLHDLRVAVRRSRSVLKEMKGVLPSEATAQARQDLRWIQEITGPTRDFDVLLADWPAMVEPVPTAMRADLAPLHELLERRRQEAFVRLRRQLGGRRFNEVWSGWRGVIDSEAAGWAQAGPRAAEPIARLAGDRVVAVYESMVRSGRRIDDASAPEALHDLRKRGKELRYLLELFGSLWPAETVKALVGALKGLQDVLGHFQDDQIQIGELRQLAPDLAGLPGGTDSVIALGFVIDGLGRSQRQARAGFAERFSAFAAPANRRLVRRTFGPGADAGGRPPAVLP
ncbi:MAG TPA: CHAD domain-containing protein [Acidimicrobiales bacterium]|nr:CHAD domain-containing protein [Acidimicrobiales bacterium]